MVGDNHVARLQIGISADRGAAVEIEKAGDAHIGGIGEKLAVRVGQRGCEIGGILHIGRARGARQRDYTSLEELDGILNHIK